MQEDIPLSRNTNEPEKSATYDQQQYQKPLQSIVKKIQIQEADFTDPQYRPWLKANFYDIPIEHVYAIAEKNATFLELPEVRARIKDAKHRLDRIRQEYPNLIAKSNIKRVTNLYNKAVTNYPEDYTDAHSLLSDLTKAIRYHPNIQAHLTKLLKSLPADDELFFKKRYRNMPAMQKRLLERENFMDELGIDLDTIPSRGLISTIVATLTLRDFFNNKFYDKACRIHTELNFNVSQLFPLYDNLNNTQQILIKACIQASYHYLELKKVNQAFAASNCLSDTLITNLLDEFADENNSIAHNRDALIYLAQANPFMLNNEIVLRKFLNEENNLLDVFTKKSSNRLFVTTIEKNIHLWIYPDIQKRVIRLAERKRSYYYNVHLLAHSIQRQIYINSEGQRFLKTNNISIADIIKDLSPKAQIRNQAYLCETINLISKYSSEQYTAVTELLITLAQPHIFTHCPQARDETVTLINLSLRKVMIIRETLDYVQGPLKNQLDKNQALNFMLETVTDTSKLALHLQEQGHTKRSHNLLQVLSSVYDTATPLIKDSIKDFIFNIPTDKAIQVITFLYPPARIPLILYSVAKSVAHIYTNIDVLKQDFNEALEAYRNGDSVALGQKITHTANDALTLALATKVVRNAVKVAKAHGIDTNTLSNSFAKRNDRGKNKVTEKPKERIIGGHLITTKEATQAAKGLGFERTYDFNFNSHGEPVFKKDNLFITPDKDRHKGGYWKMINRKGKRLATYDKDLKIIVGE